MLPPQTTAHSSLAFPEIACVLSFTGCACKSVSRDSHTSMTTDFADIFNTELCVVFFAEFCLRWLAENCDACGGQPTALIVPIARPHRTQPPTPPLWSSSSWSQRKRLRITVRPRSVAAGCDLMSRQVVAKHSQRLRPTNIKRPKKRGSFRTYRASLTVSMLSLSRLANALAPGSARLFSAAAAGENSFKVCCCAQCKNQRLTFF
jgi:hypothetical protein